MEKRSLIQWLWDGGSTLYSWKCGLGGGERAPPAPFKTRLWRKLSIYRRLMTTCI